ncbi:MAG: efflux RND transporter permease subunit, partial [Chloroflexota bacterium]|nr:efflux RND transporter permease subunit [Chloroflexota bacterium]
MLRSLIDKLTRASLRFKWATIAITVLVFIAGVVAFTQFNRELIPPVEFPQTVVLVMNPADDAETMLENITIPIENAVSDIDGVVNVESTTTSGVSAVVVMSEFGLDQDAIRQEIQTNIDALDFPEGMTPPQLLSFSLSDLPIVSVSASSDELDLVELKLLGEKEIIPELESVPGVAVVEVSGAQILPTELPPTPEPTEEPTPEPTPTEEPTLEPTTAPTEIPTEAPTEEAAEDESIPLPDSWVQAGAAQGLTLETTADLTPEVIEGIASFAPQMLDDLTPEMLLVMPVDALAALPIDYLAELDPTTQVKVAIRLVDAGVELDPVPLPDSWVQAGVAQGITLETTADLTPEIVTGISSFAPQMLDELTPIMLLVMPVDALAALPIDYLAELDPTAQVLVAIRLVDAGVEL